ncbi:MAG: NAD(+)/NADH kinase [Candidatus Acididesulfobacter guangdongensis]|uniref:NAD kinase n=1 Tax=Acididesulfobacter guangdongensis TaxID=2597225 RepID=A0A519BF21_ACIG2|nr:MAG: NAD(+)/NADH kinase [Candidatus Acididesulfobacter guangdongensis]
MLSKEFNKNIKKVLISYKKDAQEAYNAAVFISELIEDKNIKTVIRPSMDISPADLIDTGLVIVLGGDGTLLITFGSVFPLEIPMIGIDFGSLGFLVEISDNNKTEAIEKFFDGTLEFRERIALDITVRRNGGGIINYVALNEAVIAREQSIHARIINIKVCINGIWVNDYRLDGLIVSTPTGSTAYSLAAGGPIVFPDLEAFIITPICPHMLSNRPLMINSNELLRIRFAPQDNKLFISVDGRDGIRLEDGDEIYIKRHQTKFYLAASFNMSYWDILRAKLRW